jgi:hypothetical protein
MNASIRSTPGSSLVSSDCGEMEAVTAPITTVATAPIDSRAISIVNVKVMAAATLA